jgi:uncharacterized protein (TIGR03437 family)
VNVNRIILIVLSLAAARADAAVASIAAGTTHSLALKSDGTVWAWGDNGAGELGDGTTTQRNAPVQVSGLTGVAAMAAGHGHSLAARNDGTVWAWGDNNSGDLGDGTTTQRNAPVQVQGIAGVVVVAAGYSHSLAVKSDGTVWAWGDNVLGELGDGTTTQRDAPVQVSGLKGVIGISAGDDFSLAVKSDGTVWAWGVNQAGELGDGTTTTQSNTPVQVAGLTGVIAVAAGAIADSLALKSGGTAWAWGSLVQGGGSNTPVQVSGLTGVVGLSTGGYFNLAVKSDGTAWAWGNNGTGELGNGTTTNSNSPGQVNGLTGVVAVAAGFGHSLALKSDGTVWAWGWDSYGQLGNGTKTDSSNPVQVSGLTGAAGTISINAGGIVNSASSVPNAPVAPGSLASVYGSFPITSTLQANATPWPTSLSGLSVQIGGIPAPLYYVSATQLNVQVPWELNGLTQASVTATVGGQTSTPQTVKLASFAPGIFVINAQGQGAIVDALSGQLINSTNAAIAGITYVELYCTGLGPVTNQPITGAVASGSQLSETITRPTVTIGNAPAVVLYSGLAPTFIGLYQIVSVRESPCA